MANKSSIDKLPPEITARIQKHLRDKRLTLTEIIHDLQQQFPDAAKPSRSALGRYKQSVEEMVGRQRDIQAAAECLVGELGEDPTDKAGQLLVQAVTTAATVAALDANDPNAEKLSMKEVGEMARAARAVMEARTMSVKERQAIEQAARDRLLREQESNLKQIAKDQGMGEDQVRFWREKFLGIPAAT